MERFRLLLWNFRHLAVKFGCRSLIKTRALPGFLDCVEQSQRVSRIDFHRIFGSFETHAAMTLDSGIVDFVRSTSFD